MFGTAKPAASLSSNLLARKGQARPAMRHQAFVGLTGDADLEDLGWNDMGTDAAGELPTVLNQRQSLADEVTPTTAPTDEVSGTDGSAEDSRFASLTQVRVRRQVSHATAARIGSEIAARRAPKAAFTLRLDPDRHLKLRLAAAMTGQSAQYLVTQALDALLHTLPEVDTLVDNLPSGTTR